MEQAQNQKDQDIQNNNYQNELERINRKEIALIAAESKGALPDVDMNNTPDVLEIDKLSHERDKASKDYSLKMADIANKNSQNMQKLQVEREKLQIARENMANDLAVARENAKGRNKK